MLATKLPYKYTKKELNQLLKSMIILIDTREKQADHIIKYLKEHNIEYKLKKLDYGDYSFMLPAAPKLGIARDIYFTDQIVIERKNNLNELSNNLTQNRSRFENELIKSGSSSFVLLIEDPKGYQNIVNGNYRTEYNPKSYLASLLTYHHRYNITIQFIKPEYAGQFIRYELYYYCREYLK